MFVQISTQCSTQNWRISYRNYFATYTFLTRTEWQHLGISYKILEISNVSVWWEKTIQSGALDLGHREYSAKVTIKSIKIATVIFWYSRPLPVGELISIGVVKPKRPKIIEVYFNLWRIKCTVLAEDVNNTKGWISRLLCHPTSSATTESCLFTVYPRINRSKDMYAIEMNTL